MAVFKEGEATYYGHRWHEDKVVPARLQSAVMSGYKIIQPALNDPPRHPSRHFFWVLECVLTEGVSLRIGSPRAKPLSCAPRWVTLIPPNSRVWHDSRAAVGPVTFCYLSVVGGEHLGYDTFTKGGRACARFEDPDGRLQGHMLEIVEAGEKGGYGAFRKAQSLLFAITDMLYTAESVGPGVFRIGESLAARAVSPFVQKVQDLLRQNMAEGIQLQEVARQLHVSLSRLAHRYKDETGESPMRSLLRMRIDRAKDLLREGEPLKNIIAVTGFYDIYHLSRTFKQIEGLSPTQYARRMKAAGR